MTIPVLMGRIRWRLWDLATRSRRVCPSHACSAIIEREKPLREIGVDRMCRQGCEANGTCWCGNLTRTGDEA